MKSRSPHDETPEAMAGLTLIEVMITLVVLGFLLLVVARSQMTVTDANTNLHGINKVALETQEAVALIHTDISMARKLLENDSLGNSYLAALGTGKYPVAPSTRLPVIGPLAEFDKDDPLAPLTGNCLLMAEEMAPHDTVHDPGSGDQTYRVNVIRLVAYYLTQNARPRDSQLSRFDLVRWESQAFADYTTLTAITDTTAREAVVASMTAPGVNIQYAWDILKPAGSAFYSLGSDVSSSPESAFLVPPSTRPDREPRAIFGLSNACIAVNNGQTGESRIPKFAVELSPTSDPNGVGFPHGFEVKIIGPSGARKVLVRVVADIQRGQRVVRSASETKGTMRDL